MVLLREARERTDARLVDDCRGGDPSAFDEIVRRYKDRVYNVVYRFVGNHEDALDVSQEVFVRAYRSLSSFQGTSKVYTWLYTIALNLGRNRVRDGGRRGRNKGVSLDSMSREPGNGRNPDPRAKARENELDDVLQRCLNELPEHYRVPFVLRTFDDLSYEEIAEAIERPEGTVKSRINQARRLLRERLQALDVL